MGKLSGPRSFFQVEWRMVDLLAKACAHAGIALVCKMHLSMSCAFVEFQTHPMCHECVKMAHGVIYIATSIKKTKNEKK